MSTSPLSGLLTEVDIVRLVDAFCTRVNDDPLLRPMFNDIAQVDWAKHPPTIYDF